MAVGKKIKSKITQFKISCACFRRKKFKNLAAYKLSIIQKKRNNANDYSFKLLLIIIYTDIDPFKDRCSNTFIIMQRKIPLSNFIVSQFVTLSNSSVCRKLFDIKVIFLTRNRQQIILYCCTASIG